jgi:carboxyl-terminal processing protease
MNFIVSTRVSRLLRAAGSCVPALLFAALLSISVSAQNFSNSDREAGREMLSMIQMDIEKNYYDPNFHGIDLKTRFKTADDRIKQAKSNSEIFGIIAQVLLDFDDSHLYFNPPPRASDVKYGWLMQMVGDKCFVTSVQPGSDAEAKGLKTGDQVLSLDGFEPNRDILWKIQYLYYGLKPKAAVKMIVAAPDGSQRQIDIAAKVVQKAKMVDLTSNNQRVMYGLDADAENRLDRHRYIEGDEKVFIWKMPAFDMYDDSDVDAMIGKAKKHETLIVDLRGNGGGLVKMLQRLIGNLFDHDVKLWDEKRRKETKPLVAKTRGSEAYKGKLVVIVDSRCGSAAELFARIVQLEKRGTVIGDKTSGSVMESLRYSHQVGIEIVIPYGASVTIADLTMTDGKSLEHVGVTPDEFLIPTAADLAAGRDPVMARAAAILGVEVSPEKAGKFFPIEWRK